MSKESVYFNITNLTDKHDLKLIKKDLGSIRGVISVSVNTENHQVAVDFDNSGVSRNQIEQNISELGYNVTSTTGEHHIM